MRTYHVTSSLIPVLVLVATTAVSAQELTKEEVPGIRNYTRVDATIACAGATSLDALTEIQRRGFAAIVNFRTEGENGAQPAAAAERAEELGLKYFHIPFRGSAPTVEAAEEFRKARSLPTRRNVTLRYNSAPCEPITSRLR